MFRDHIQCSEKKEEPKILTVQARFPVLGTWRPPMSDFLLCLIYSIAFYLYLVAVCYLLCFIRWLYLCTSLFDLFYVLFFYVSFHSSCSVCV